MAKCLSFTAYRDWFYRYSLAKAGLRSLSSNLGDGTSWVPRISKPSKPSRSASPWLWSQCNVAICSWNFSQARLNRDTRKVPDILSVSVLTGYVHRSCQGEEGTDPGYTSRSKSF
ncbi:hypothetical protein NC652_037804 [Populus alba x Populus x berolinensis]|uniref:Uncharacterized protein n=2 Tax=Populus TaxID=3689 RepID=A0A4U5QQX4_POPAL|nr:hypothetical protein NC652_037804 [Populus alba x Populus x berolinensis]KAJ6959451.1 hypothetical protein NC653_037708 [Populus alba x Populus x berolinensis]TKS12891.1 hypothetical protein D5086_0000058430 [Populus alba]